MMQRSLKTLILLPFLILASCSGEKDGEKDKPEKSAIQSEVRSLKSEIDSVSAEGKLPKKRMRELMDAYKSYAEHYPDDSLTPEHLFRAGGVARSLDEPQRAINIYRRILNEYPDTEKEPTIRFLLAFIYDQDLKKTEKAKELYRAVIDSFPDHKLAQDAKEYLKVIDLSDEELIERFEKKQKEQEKAKES